LCYCRLLWWAVAGDVLFPVLVARCRRRTRRSFPSSVLLATVIVIVFPSTFHCREAPPPRPPVMFLFTPSADLRCACRRHPRNHRTPPAPSIHGTSKHALDISPNRGCPDILCHRSRARRGEDPAGTCPNRHPRPNGICISTVTSVIDISFCYCICMHRRGGARSAAPTRARPVRPRAALLPGRLSNHRILSTRPFLYKSLFCWYTPCRRERRSQARHQQRSTDLSLESLTVICTLSLQ
jgi:hypothetical protein